SLDPGMNWIGRDNVKRLVGRQNEVPRIIMDNLDTRIIDNVIILLGEERGDDLRHERLDFADYDLFHFRMNHEATRGDAGAAADYQDRARLRVEQGGEVTKHALEPHVRRIGRSFYFATHMEVAHFAILHDRNRGVYPLAHVQVSPCGVV